jgi:hypothetical protein
MVNVPSPILFDLGQNIIPSLNGRRPLSYLVGPDGRGPQKYYGIDLDAVRKDRSRSNSKISSKNRAQQLNQLAAVATPTRKFSEKIKQKKDLADRGGTLPSGFAFSSAQLPLRPPQDQHQRSTGDGGANSPTLTATDAEVAFFFADLDTPGDDSCPSVVKSWPNVSESASSTALAGGDFKSSDLLAAITLNNESLAGCEKDNVPKGNKAQRSSSLKNNGHMLTKLGLSILSSRSFLWRITVSPFRYLFIRVFNPFSVYIVSWF